MVDLKEVSVSKCKKSKQYVSNIKKLIQSTVIIYLEHFLLILISVVKCMVQHQDGDKYGRISTPIQEAFVYEAAILSKVDMDTATVQLTVCGRSRRTGQGVPIASLSLPLSAGLEIVLAEHFPLEYKTDLEDASCMKQESLNVSTMSETKTGKLQVICWQSSALHLEKIVTSPHSTLSYSLKHMNAKPNIHLYLPCIGVFNNNNNNGLYLALLRLQ